MTAEEAAPLVAFFNAHSHARDYELKTNSRNAIVAARAAAH